MLHAVSLGQGQDIIALQWLEISHKDGHWVLLENIHLMPSRIERADEHGCRRRGQQQVVQQHRALA